MCYKLVPIKTPINENEPYKMGMIDSQKMVEIVKNWEWGKREKMMPLMVEFVKKNPKWKISLQTHKFLNIP